MSVQVISHFEPFVVFCLFRIYIFEIDNKVMLCIPSHAAGSDIYNSVPVTGKFTVKLQ